MNALLRVAGLQMRRWTAAGNPDLVADVSRRVKAGEDWDGKRLRQGCGLAHGAAACSSCRPTPVSRALGTTECQSRACA